MQKEKVRVYILARELKVDTKDLLDMCKQAGIEVKNQLSNLEPEQREAIEQLVKHKSGGGGGTAAPGALPLGKVPTISRPAPTPTSLPPTPAASSSPSPSPVASPSAPPPPTIAAKAADLIGRVRNLNQARPRPSGPDGDQASAAPPRKMSPPRPGLTRHGLATLPKPKGPPPVKKEEKKAGETAQKPIAYLPAELRRGGAAAGHEAAKGLIGPAGQNLIAPPALDEEEEDGQQQGGTRPGAVKGRDERHKRRSQRAKDRRDTEATRIRTTDIGVEEDDRPGALLKQRIRQRAPKRITEPRKGKVPITMPIQVRSLSEALGVPAKDLQRKLMDRGHMVTINAVLEPELAHELALEQGVELEIKKPLDPEEQLLAKLDEPDRPEDLVPRAPIVTIMGHVDHGKTSLLDRIRESNVVATEAGGITQHLRAWRVQHNGRSVTFLDTPGHEAFTQMRARGANVTDVVVLVVAADDGVMPQTEEAINHAKAAKVPIVVAINKIDLPNANVNRTRQQLYSRELLPDDMGGQSPFVETISTKEKAKAIDDLLEQIGLVSDVMLELKANPKKAARGVCLEAKLSEGEGVIATLLVRDGTLRRGDIILCGCTYGRVRAMYDDLGRPLEEAGPSWPVRITGLDEVPNADDLFQVVPDLSLAREISLKRTERSRAAAPFKNATFRLEDLDKTKVAELKLVVKADVRGSVEAIRKEMEKLVHAEVRVNVLHTAIGGITESDVQLALASPENTLIVGFNVVPDDRAQALANEKGVQIRRYEIIYQLTDDIRAALEGKLKPREEIVHLGRAVVRNTFKISRVGTIAGCHVTQGTIERSARVQLIRDGAVIYPPTGRSVGLESLKRFKDDVRDVREGFECGIKIAGYDDVKVGDVIEAFRIDEVQRTL